MAGTPDMRRLSLDEIRKRLEATDVLDQALLEMLAADERAGARALYRQLSRRLARQRQETDRLRELYRREQEWGAAGLGPVAGLDEAGRGPLAGPVVAAAVILPHDRVIPELKDSKQLTGEVRVRVAARIRQEARAWGIGLASVEEIESINILQASLLAMRRALVLLGLKPGWVLVDGAVSLPGYAGKQTALVGGDRISASVAAASVLAKVYRDELMQRVHRQYPQYGFDRHKGYGTAEHYGALEYYGPCPVHRRSFLHAPSR